MTQRKKTAEEINKKIRELDVIADKKTELDTLLDFKFDYSSDYQKSNRGDMFTYQSVYTTQLNTKTSEIKFDHTIFDKFSIFYRKIS